MPRCSFHTYKNGNRTYSKNFTTYLFKKYFFKKNTNFEENGGVTYSLQKEIFGVGCPNKILVKMQFDSGKNLKSRKIENGEFIEEE